MLKRHQSTLDNFDHHITAEQTITLKRRSIISEFAALSKMRLSLTVVFTSVLGLLIASKGNVNAVSLLLLSIGGFLITAAANTINQVLEKDYDRLMSRTEDRPLAAGRMKISDAVLFAGITCLIGTTILSTFNPLTGVLGMISFILYSFVYTPLKRYSPAAVAVGAVPGALPVLIGCTAAQGNLTWLAIGLFFIQFFWQFPHFWSIGYLGFDDYKKAGFKLIPEKNGGIDRSIAINGMFYIALIIPVLYGLFRLSIIELPALLVALLTTSAFMYVAHRFDKEFDRKSALRLMFFSFFYIPILLISFLIF